MCASVGRFLTLVQTLVWAMGIVVRVRRLRDPIPFVCWHVVFVVVTRALRLRVECAAVGLDCWDRIVILESELTNGLRGCCFAEDVRFTHAGTVLVFD